MSSEKHVHAGMLNRSSDQPVTSDSLLDEKRLRLEAVLKDLDSVIVAYSGGVDSSLLAYHAHEVLGSKARIVIAVSPSLAAEELVAARWQADLFNWNLMEIATNETELPEYARNDGNRCYYCKKTLFVQLRAIAEAQGIRHIAYGAIVDDMDDYRPGHRAAQEFHVLSPLQQVGLTKEEIRRLARTAGLPSWDRPQAACLSSRFPTFQPVTAEALKQVEQAEDYLHSLGFRQLRVRHHGDLARIELEEGQLPALMSDRAVMLDIANRLRSLGYRYVTLDLEPYRRGSSNRTADQATGV